jgi:hypothetical protein
MIGDTTKLDASASATVGIVRLDPDACRSPEETIFPEIEAIFTIGMI